MDSRRLSRACSEVANRRPSGWQFERGASPLRRIAASMSSDCHVLVMHICIPEEPARICVRQHAALELLAEARLDHRSGAQPWSIHIEGDLPSPVAAVFHHPCRDLRAGGEAELGEFVLYVSSSRSLGDDALGRDCLVCHSPSHQSGYPQIRATAPVLSSVSQKSGTEEVARWVNNVTASYPGRPCNEDGRSGSGAARGRNPQRRLTADTEGFTARGENLQLGARPEQRLGQRGYCIDLLLAVVDREEQADASGRGSPPAPPAPAAPTCLAHTQGSGNDVGEQRRPPHLSRCWSVRACTGRHAGLRCDGS